MLEFVAYYFVGLLITINIVFLYFNSSFVLNVSEWITKRKDIYCFDDYAALIERRLPNWLSDFLTCGICISFWVSFFVGLILSLLIFNAALLFAAWLSYTVWVYVFFEVFGLQGF